MVSVRPFTARVGVRIGLVVVLSIVVVIVVPTVVFAVAWNLPDRYPFSLLRSAVGTLGLGVVCVLLILGLIVAFWALFSKGRVSIDSSGMRWKIGRDSGEIRWDEPFSVRRWQSVFSSGGYSYDVPGVSVPVLVCEVSQGDRRITFWHAESLRKLEGLPSGPLYGVPLLHRARRVTRTIGYVYDAR